MKDGTKLLLCTNGAESGLAALEYGVWLADLIKIPVSLLGVVEDQRMLPAVQEAIQSAQSRLDELGIHSSHQIEHGNLIQILSRVVSQDRHIVTIGRLGRPRFTRWVRGAAFRRIAHHITSPVLYVPAPHNQLRRILICLGGLGYAQSVEEQALNLAQKTGARVTLLHVVEPITLEYPIANIIQQHPGDILATDTPQGGFLREALQIAHLAGVDVEFRELHGEIVSRILSEIDAQGDYDLVAMGWPESSSSLRQRFTPNVTAEIAESCAIPVLTVRHGWEGLIDGRAARGEPPQQLYS